MEQVNTKTWLDYTIENNLAGVLKVLASYGFIGLLEPKSIEDVREASFMVMEDYGDEGTIALLQAHPQYLVFKELFDNGSMNQRSYSNYHNAIGGISTKIDSFVSKLSPIDRVLVAAGIFVAAYYVLQETKKK